MKYQDFVGFTLDGTHSSDLGIYRTSDGNGFTFNPLPATKENISQITGRDGTLYWGRQFQSSSIDFTIAYDNLTETNMRTLSLILKKREPLSLIFDEMPYKQYFVVPTNSCRLDYVCFSTGLSSDEIKIPHAADLPGHATPEANPIYETGRVYRGEGTLKFNIYDPYAHSIEYDVTISSTTTHYNSKFIDNVYYNNRVNKTDWNSAIGLINQSNMDIWIAANSKFNVYNPGDKDTPVKIYIPLTYAANRTFTGNITYSGNSIQLNDLVLKSTEHGIIIDTELQVIRGFTIDTNNKINPTNTIYNQYLGSAQFFEIKERHTELTDAITLTWNTDEPATETPQYYTVGTPSIKYDYLFL